MHRATVIIMGHQAILMYAMKEIGWPRLSAMPTVTTLALAPIIVPFPPRQAPSAKDHHKIPLSAPGITWFR